MTNKSEYVKKWRYACKERIIKTMGGSCCICGYSKSQSGLSLHHLDPSQKDFSFGAIRANPKNWDSIVEELRKCVLVCQNCHCEIHEGIVVVPQNAPSFNEEFADYKLIDFQKSLSPCTICGKLKPKHQKTCSRACAAVVRYKIDWDSIDLKKELKTKSIIGLAQELGISDGAVHKRLKKLNLK